MKHALPHVTLLCADCVDAERAAKVLERCAEVCDFGAKVLLTSLPSASPDRVEIGHLGSLCDYSIFMLKEAHKHVRTSHVLVVQHDGWILNADAWEPEWVELDYVGPLFIHEHEIVHTSVGTGGFSYRSKRLMERVSELLPPWDGTPAGTDAMMNFLGSYEDGVISMRFRDQLVREGFKFATPDQAARFAQGGQNNLIYYVPRPFGFHGLWPNVNKETGFVSPPPFWTK